ncbi:MAG: peptidylprolyl isomerase [Spirochaetales bacterium]|nr:peptidylprolyl isomerase [Spirochaetales bacterium]
MLIEKNKLVAIKYVLKSAGGEIIDQSEKGQPFEYLHGAGGMISGLERELEGKHAGDSFSAAIEPADACGLYDESLILKIKREKFDTEEEISAGMQFGGQTGDGKYRVFHVVAVQGDTITVDGNHPLAGQKLFFDITVESIREAAPGAACRGQTCGKASRCGGCPHGTCPRSCPRNASS